MRAPQLLRGIIPDAADIGASGFVREDEWVDLFEGDVEAEDLVEVGEAAVDDLWREPDLGFRLRSGLRFIAKKYQHCALPDIHSEENPASLVAFSAHFRYNKPKEMMI